jgi:hypothetical protein
VLAKVKQPDLKVYTVWVPILWSDGKVSIPQATKRLNDGRVSHYWDQNKDLVREYSRVLQIDGPAWDVYLLFDRNAEWTDRAPTPIYWMNKLGLENGTDFDGGKLAQKVRELIGAPRPNATANRKS